MSLIPIPLLLLKNNLALSFSDDSSLSLLASFLSLLLPSPVLPLVKCIYIYVYMYVCIYIYVYVYIYIYISGPRNVELWYLRTGVEWHPRSRKERELALLSVLLGTSGVWVMPTTPVRVDLYSVYWFK